ncbi:hypothetical protein A9239_10850 [Methanosarcina sp. A14]|uniref:hypothetical protein n=1 Tax=Methanosarcina sp. A14 TaxID=1860098 RepID=UPI000868E750|nr:hypothetical protein [Methanosarcina sp. A14]OED06852.1 hypothetical protein A9239_10850 [Methanosarcina sp. A14]
MDKLPSSRIISFTDLKNRIEGCPGKSNIRKMLSLAIGKYLSKKEVPVEEGSTCRRRKYLSKKEVPVKE